MSKCAICFNEVDSENAAILTMSGYGTPRYLCPDCEADIELATTSTDYKEATGAMERLSTKATRSNPDKQTFAALTEILASAAERARAIADGTYDFSEDTAEQTEELEEIPEQLLETEADAEADRRDEARLKKFDKIFNYVAGVILAGFAAVLIWRILDAYLF
jgi:hypothetical protein